MNNNSLTLITKEYKKYKENKIALKPYLQSMKEISIWLNSKGK